MVEIEKINYNRVRMHDTMKLIKILTETEWLSWN